MISSVLSSSHSFLKDTAGCFSLPLGFPTTSLLASFPLSVTSVSPPSLLLFCFLPSLSSSLVLPPLSPCPPLVSSLPSRRRRRKKQKREILSLPAQLLLLGIKSKPHGGLQHHGSLVVDVCWVSVNIKTCRLGRKIKAGGPSCSGLSAKNVLSVWEYGCTVELQRENWGQI